MKRWFFIALLALGNLPHGLMFEAMGQPPFSKRYNPSGDQNKVESALSILPWHNGGYLMIGTGEWEFVQNDLNYLTSVTWITVLDEQGEVVSVEQVFDPAVATFPGLVNSGFMLPDGRYCFAGGPSEEGSQYMALFWVSTNGVLDSMLTYGALGEETIARQVRPSMDGGYVICGGRGTALFNHPALLKVLPDGTQDWIRYYPTPNLDEFKSLSPVGSGFYLGGGWGEYSSSTNRRVMRVDSIGDVLWEQVWGGQFKDQPPVVCALTNGNVAVGSASRYNVNGQQSRHYLAELDQLDGSIVWEREYDAFTGYKTLSGLLEVPGQGGLLGTGYSRINGYNQGVLLRTAANGDSLWLRYYDYNDSITVAGQGVFAGAAPTADGGFVCAGIAWPTPNYSQDMWVVKVDSMGCIEPGCHIITGITTQVTNLKEALRVWPNPVASGGTVTVGITLPEGLQKEPLRLSLISATGSLVHEQPLPAAVPAFTFTLPALTSGAYFLHLSTQDTWLSGTKLIVE